MIMEINVLNGMGKSDIMDGGRREGIELGLPGCQQILSRAGLFLKRQSKLVFGSILLLKIGHLPSSVSVEFYIIHY